MKKREGNYDLLRITCTIAVIMIHVSALWFTNSKGDIQMPMAICIYNSVTRASIPCFIMLSGAFILDNENNLDYKVFYSKSFSKIGVPTIVFSILYILYRIPPCFIGEDKGISILLIDIVKGSPVEPMWYLYMLIGVYAMVPVILRFKNSISERNFYRISFVFLILAVISGWTSTVSINWDIGQSFEYLGYFMVGYSIRKMCKEKNNLKAFTVMCGGLFLELCAAWLVYKYESGEIPDLKYAILSPFSPLIAVSSVLIFYGFTLMNIKKNFAKCTDLTFFIYLIHPGVWDFTVKLFYILNGGEHLTYLNGTIWIIIFTIIIFVISYYLSKLYLWIWNKIDKENRITKFLTKMVHLQI